MCRGTQLPALGSDGGCGSWGLQRCHELPCAHRSSSQPAPNLRKNPSISPKYPPITPPTSLGWGWAAHGAQQGSPGPMLGNSAQPGAPRCQQHLCCTTTARCRGARRAEGTGKPRQPLLSPIILSRRGFIPPGSKAGAAAGCRGRAGWRQGRGISAGICPQPSRPAGKRGTGTCCTAPAALAGDAAAPESPNEAQTRPRGWGSCSPARRTPCC